tara:strand:+ start:667 stop:825 length:159 start_codon:yes stop_codon:yes gene_type:complete
MILTELQTALSILFGVMFLGYVSAFIFVHYLDNTDNGHMLAFLRRKWKEWKK